MSKKTKTSTKGKEPDDTFNETKEFIMELLNSLPEGVFVVDQNKTIKLVNDYFLKQYKYQKDEVVGHNCFEKLHGEKQPCSEGGTDCPLEQVFQTGKSVKMEHIHIDKNGNKFIIEISAFPLLNEEGEVKYMVGASRDITDRKLKENLLKASEQKFKMLFDTSNVGIMYLDPGGNIIDANPKVMELLACNREDIIGKNFIVFFTTLHMGSKDLLSTFDDKIMDTPDSVTEWKITNKKGEKLVLLAHPSFIMKNGRLIGRYIVVENITERNRAKNALLELEKKLQIMFESIPEGMTFSDLEGNILEMNEAALNLAGFDSKDEIIGKSAFELISEKEHPKAREFLQKTFLEGYSGEVEYKLLKKNKKEYDAELSASLLKDQTGEPIGFVALIKDITNRKSEEQKIIDDKNRAELYLDLVSHDISNFNQSIISSNELLLTKYDFTDEQKKYIEMSLNQAKEISNLIYNVRKLTRLKESESVQDKIDINKILNNSITHLNQTYQNRRFKVNHNITESKVFVKGNELLEEVFYNILRNAIKFDRSDDAVIDISSTATEDNKFWKFEFKDRGPGVPDVMKDNIFKRFEKAEEKLRGSGFGLTLAFEIISKCGGKIWVEDRVKGDTGQGSNFVVLLPKEV
ncbi:MAG: PAS domain-containing sensor histidine kinase [Thermoplasmata archaeon]|nr:MAG: PAS domain-containing sensor histidine kinase [Thermoplasmata archaeon]